MTSPTPYSCRPEPAADPRERSPLKIAEDAFVWLVTGPRPVGVNGRRFDELPDREVPLHELRTRMMSRRLRPETRDAIWAHLVMRARTETRAPAATFRTGGIHPERPGREAGRAPGRSGRVDGRRDGRREGGSTWTLACVGVALPVLARISIGLSTRFPDPADIEAAVLVGFIDEVHRTDVFVPRIMPRLRRAAYRSAQRLRGTVTATVPLAVTAAPRTNAAAPALSCTTPAPTSATPTSAAPTTQATEAPALPAVNVGELADTAGDAVGPGTRADVRGPRPAGAGSGPRPQPDLNAGAPARRVGSPADLARRSAGGRR